MPPRPGPFATASTFPSAGVATDGRADRNARSVCDRLHISQCRRRNRRTGRPKRPVRFATTGAQATDGPTETPPRPFATARHLTAVGALSRGQFGYLRQIYGLAPLRTLQH